MVKVKAGQLHFLLPLLGFLSFTLFHLLKTEPAHADVNIFLRDRLRELARRFDEDNDGKLSDEELLEWYRIVDVEDKARELKVYWEGCETNGDGRVTLPEYMNYMSILKDEKVFTRQAQTRFIYADRDNDMYLNRGEFSLFLFPELSPEMNELLYEEEMNHRDRNGDGFLTLLEYLGIEGEIEDIEERLAEYAVKQNMNYYRNYLDKDGDGLLSPSEIMSWVSDGSRRHLRHKVRDVLRRWDGNRNRELDIETEIVRNLRYFKDNELTQYGDMLFYRDEL